MPDESRVLPGSAVSILWNWRVGSVSTAPSGTTAVAITRPDGSPLPGAPTTAPSTANAAKPGEVAFVLPAQAECTKLRVVWTATVGGTLRNVTSYVEVVGEHLFDLADLRTFEWGGFTQGGAPLADPVKYPDEKLQQVRDQIADEIEEWTQTSPMERYTRSVLYQGGTRRLLLDYYHPRRILSLSTGLTPSAWTAPQIAALQLGISVIEHPTSSFYDPVVIEYVRGLEKVPATIAEAAKKIAILKLRPSQIPPRAISITDERGTMALAQPSYERRRYYGVPEIDTALATIDETILSSA